MNRLKIAQLQGVSAKFSNFLTSKLICNLSVTTSKGQKKHQKSSKCFFFFFTNIWTATFGLLYSHVKLFILIINDPPMWHPLGLTRARHSLHAFAELLLLLNRDVPKSWSDHMQDHVCFDNAESKSPINHQKSYRTLLNLLFHILRPFFWTSISRLPAYLQWHSRWIQAIWNTVSILLEIHT